MRARLWKATASLAAVAALVLGGVLIAAPQASAANGHIYVSLPTWLGNCPRGGSVKELHVTTWTPAVSDYQHDKGDDLVYIKVALNESNTVVSQPVCRNGSKSYPGTPSTDEISPSRSGQTWWLGPKGVRHN